MYKKIISLMLVLALAGISSASTAWWNPHVAVGDWEVASNWTTSTVPDSGDTAYLSYQSPGDYPAITINLSSVRSPRLKWGLTPVTLNINSNGGLINNGSVGSVQIYGNTADTMNISSGGKFIARGSTTGLQTGIGTHTFNINSGGLMGVYGTISHLSTNALYLGGTSGGAGSTTISVLSGGILDADSITLANANHVVKLYTGGVIYVYGTVSGSITSGDGGTILTQSVTDPVADSPLYGLTVTKYYIPEPATLLLLGLGGLMLRKRS